MVSINSSSNGYVLSNLRQINSDLAMSQTRIGTGKKVNSSSDNAMAWKTAQTIKSDLKAQDSLSTGMAKAKGRADAAVAAIDTAISLAGKIQELAQEYTASGATTANATTTAKIGALQTQIASVLGSAGIDGENWLSTAGAGAKTVTIGTNSGVASTVAVTAVDATAFATTFSGTTAITDQASATAYSTAATTFVDAVTSYQGTLSTFSEALGFQQDFQSALKGIRNEALSSLLDADLTEESAKISALQTQQQLAYQALAITNSSAQNILALFR